MSEQLLLLIARLLAIALTGAVASCSATAGLRPLGQGERWLPAGQWERDGERFLCGGGGFVDVTLRGSPDDPRLAWGSSPRGRMELSWPVGYSARFRPLVEVLDESGRVVMREGDPVPGGCVLAEPNVWYVSPP